MTPEERVRRAAALLAEAWQPRNDLPWRQHPDPYRVFLAELLLIRTRWDVVARLFEDVVRRFPDIRALAEASEEELAEVLAPLGLRKRIPLIKRAARYVVEEHGGRIPDRKEELEKIPGLGPYTAAAVAALAFGEPVVPADVNVYRFLSRLTGLPMGHPTKGNDALRDLVPWLSPQRGGPPVAALLDFLRLICRPRAPRCDRCPLRPLCVYGGGQTESGVP